MKRKIKKLKNHDLPLGRLKEVADFLPPPEKLVSPEETVKVTLALDRQSLEFFKNKAARLGTKYQKMIRELLKSYTAHFS